MNTNSPDSALTPEALRRAIEEHFRQRTPEQVVARAEELTPRPPTYRQSHQSFSLMVAEASWLLMVCNDSQSSAKAIVFALSVCKELTAFTESVSDPLIPQDAPAMIITVHAKSMLVPQPTTVAKDLKGVTESTTFQHLERNLSAWASPEQLPEKKCLLDAANIFARIAPILAKNAI